mmetsp:Transcript_84658/g.252284  ORF Transcript_84658/g.252284 Transcript_84658/m.252284 type:complete len:104 (-) Transcript_84658:139-450(-)
MEATGTRTGVASVAGAGAGVSATDMPCWAQAGTADGVGWSLDGWVAAVGAAVAEFGSVVCICWYQSGSGGCVIFAANNGAVVSAAGTSVVVGGPAAELPVMGA